MGRGRSKRMLRLTCVAAMALCAPAHAQRSAHYAIDPQPLKSALIAFGLQSGRGVVGASTLTCDRTSRGFLGDTTDAVVALRQVLRGTGLTFRREGDDFVIVAPRGQRTAPREDPARQTPVGRRGKNANKITSDIQI